MMKKITFVLVFTAIALTACSQGPDQTFEVPALFKKSITVLDTIFFRDGTYLKTALTGTGATDWNTLLNKPTSFPSSAHDHNALYKPVGYVPSWAELTGKPATFTPAAHDHATLYKPISYVPSWAEITGKPAEIELIDELPKMAYTPLVQKTTAEINVLVIPSGTIAMVWDKTLGVLKIYSGNQWKTIITNQ